MPKDNIEEIRSRALERNRKLQVLAPTSAPNTPQTSLDSVLNDPGATWHFSSTGAGGASLIQSDNLSSGGAAIKIEHSGSITSVERSGKFMEEFFKRAQGPLPFVAPRIQVYTKADFDQTPGMKDQFQRKLDEEKQEVSPNRVERVDDHKDNLDALAANDSHSVLVMEFGKGKLVSSLPTSEKETLVRCDAFAQSMGRAMIPSIALGLKDHMGTSVSNVSNLMYDPDTGSLSVIDYEPGPASYVNGHALVGKENYAPRAMREIREYLEKAAESPEAFEEAVNEMCNPRKDGPLSQMMRAFTGFGSSYGERMFVEGEEDAADGFTLPERRNFAANLLKGAIDGLEYMQQNAPALEQAVKATHETKPDGTTLEHFYDDTRMAEFKEEIQKLDAPQLRTKMNQSFQQWQQKAQQQDLTEYQQLQAKLAITNRRIDRIEKHPTRMDRIKAFFSRRHHEPIDLYHAKRDALEKQLERLGDVPGYSAFQQKMVNGQVDTPPQVNQGRTQLTTARRGVTPQNAGNQTNDTTNTQGRDQLTSARRGGPQPNTGPQTGTTNVPPTVGTQNVHPGISPPPNYPPPPLPNTTQNVNVGHQPPSPTTVNTGRKLPPTPINPGTQTQDQQQDTTDTSQHPPKVSDIIKSFEKSQPPPENLRNREGQRAKPRVRDVTQTTDQTTQGEGHGTGRKV